MSANVFLVNASGLNLRELSDVGATVLVVLPRGQIVTRLDGRDWGGDGSFWRVQADLTMMSYQGYVAKSHLASPNPPPSGRSDLRVTEADMIKLSSNARRDLLPGLAAGFNETFPRYALDTGLRISHFMAQVAHESRFRYLEKIGSAEYLARCEGRVDLGNTQPGDGARHKGRGIIQLTGRANYRDYGRILGVDLETNPERAATPEIAVKVACEYWKRRRINEVAEPSQSDSLISASLKVMR
jgi:putative chitinase